MYEESGYLITELLKTESTEVTLITRPRRFGKTLGMSMLADTVNGKPTTQQLKTSILLLMRMMQAYYEKK